MSSPNHAANAAYWYTIASQLALQQYEYAGPYEVAATEAAVSAAEETVEPSGGK